MPEPPLSPPNRPAAPAPPAAHAASADAPAPGPQVLIYRPDGPLGGTFTCTLCQAQAWQPDLLLHGPGCPFVPNPARR